MRTINPNSTRLLRLQDVQHCPLTSTPFGIQRPPLHKHANSMRHALVVTAAAATEAPKKSTPKKKHDHPEIPNMPMVGVVAWTLCVVRMLEWVVWLLRIVLVWVVWVLRHTYGVTHTHTHIHTQPKAFQQTMKSSFTVGGIGLHTADYGMGLLVSMFFCFMLWSSHELVFTFQCTF